MHYETSCISNLRLKRRVARSTCRFESVLLEHEGEGWWGGGHALGGGGVGEVEDGDVVQVTFMLPFILPVGAVIPISTDIIQSL
jgi:hypothetical protein